MKTPTTRIEHPLARGAEATPDDLWEFPEGLIGLPDHRCFALVPLPDAPPFRLLASVDDPSFGLVVVEPASFVPGYELALDVGDLAPLAERDPSRLSVLVPVVLPGEATPLSLNLKGPLLLSPAERRGIQRVSPHEEHVLRWTPERGDERGPACSS